MNKNIKKMGQLLNDDTPNYSSEVIALSNMIDIYFNGFREGLLSLNSKDVSFVLEKHFGKHINCFLTWLPNKVVRVKVNQDDKDIEIYFDCHRPEDIYIMSSNYSDANLDLKDLDTYKEILKDSIKEYALNAIKFEKDYDSSHDSIHAINGDFVIYLVDNEAIIFITEGSYIDVIMQEDGDLLYECHCTNYEVLKAIGDDVDRLFNKIYININDAPLFLKTKLQEFRDNELKDINYQSNNKPAKRIRNLFTKD